MERLICSYCGKVREKMMFCIGACVPGAKEWTMWEHSGKVSCPDCEEKGRKESNEVLEKYCS